MHVFHVFFRKCSMFRRRIPLMPFWYCFLMMNQILFFVLYRGTIELLAERYWKLIRLSAIISPYLAKVIEHNKFNTDFMHGIVIVFSPIYWSEAAYVISSFNLRAEYRNQFQMQRIFHEFIDHLREKQYTSHSLTLFGMKGGKKNPLPAIPL